MILGLGRYTLQTLIEPLTFKFEDKNHNYAANARPSLFYPCYLFMFMGQGFKDQDKSNQIVLEPAWYSRKRTVVVVGRRRLPVSASQCMAPPIVCLGWKNVCFRGWVCCCCWIWYLFPSRCPVHEATVHFAWYQNTDRGNKEILLVLLVM